jgi:putative transposase
MPYVKNWLHCVWGTKNRVRFLSGNIKDDVVKHILKYAREKSIYIDILNGSTEHLHCLLSINYEMSLSKVMQLIKGESSYWINKNSLTTEKFE